MFSAPSAATNRQGWRFVSDGADPATATSSLITSSLTRSPVYPSQERRLWASSAKLEPRTEWVAPSVMPSPPGREIRRAFLHEGRGPLRLLAGGEETGVDLGEEVDGVLLLPDRADRVVE
jgi:hypothetical protein